MRELADKLKAIIATARGATQKRLSELTDEEKYAVMFVGDYYPAKWEGGKIKYSRDSQHVVWSGSYVEVSKALKSLDPEAKGFSANAIHVLIDEPIPLYEETDFRSALLSDDMIPRKQGLFAHLPYLEPEQISLDKVETYRGIGMMVASLHVALSKDLELTPMEKAVHFITHRYKDTFKELTKSLGLPSATILNMVPEYDRAARGTLSYEDTNSAMSYCATYIYYAFKGIKLKAEREN